MTIKVFFESLSGNPVVTATLFRLTKADENCREMAMATKHYARATKMIITVTLGEVTATIGRVTANKRPKRNQIGRIQSCDSKGNFPS